MKNLSLILNAVLFVAVGILFYLHFKKPNTVVTPENTEVTANVEEPDSLLNVPVELPELNSGEGAIAFIDLENLTENYDFYKQGIKNLEADYKKKQQELLAKQQKLEEDFARYQKLAPTMTEEVNAMNEKKIMEDEQKLYALRDKLREDFAGKDEDFNKEFLKKIDAYLKGLSKEKKYSYIFTYVKGGPGTIVYANDSLNITKEVVQGLNREYRKKK